MYEYQNRGMVERYYDKTLIENMSFIRGGKYLKYRQMWDDKNQVKNVYKVPLEIMVELTSWCNYTCKMCIKNFVTNKERINMPLELVKKIADNAREMNVASLWIGAGSECLIHPEAKEALDILLSVPTLDSTLLTNGSCLNEDIARLLIDKNCKNVSVSLDASRKDTYKAIRGGDLTHVEKNIDRLLSMRGNNDFPRLRVSMVKMEDNVDQREEFLQKWEGKADIIDYQNLIEYKDNDKQRRVGFYENFSCLDPFRRLYVNYDGNIYPCCMPGFLEGHYLGNIKEITLMEAWNGAVMDKLRDELRSGKLSENCIRCFSSHK